MPLFAWYSIHMEPPNYISTIVVRYLQVEVCMQSVRILAKAIIIRIYCSDLV